MATAAAIPIGEYLHTRYEHDREYVRGEVIERSMPTYDHARLQAALAAYFWPLQGSHGLFVATELRCRLAPDVIRIPDVAVFSPAPTEPIPSVPPLVTIEILSPDDRFAALLAKCAEYHQWGVRHVWTVDPAERRLFVYDGKDLRLVPEWVLADRGLTIAPAVLFDGGVVQP